MTDGVLLQPLNLTNLILQNSYIVIMALGMLLVIVAGHIDLSVGSVVGFVGALAAVLMVQVRHRPRHRRRSSASSSARADRRGAGLFRRLFQDPVLHRHAGRHAGVPGPDARAAAAASRSGRSRSRSSSWPGFIPDFAGPWTSMLIAARARRVARRSSSELARAPQAAPASTASPDEPFGFFVVRRTASLAALIVGLRLPAGSYRGLPNVLIVMSVLMIALRASSPPARRSAGASTRSAATRRRRGCRASRPSA